MWAYAREWKHEVRPAQFRRTAVACHELWSFLCAVSNESQRKRQVIAGFFQRNNSQFDADILPDDFWNLPHDLRAWSQRSNAHIQFKRRLVHFRKQLFQRAARDGVRRTSAEAYRSINRRSSNSGGLVGLWFRKWTILECDLTSHSQVQWGGDWTRRWRWKA